MRILQINITCNSGSTGKIAVNLNNSLLESGHEGIIAYGYGDTDYNHSYKIGGFINYYYHNIMSRIFGHEGFYSIIATKRFIKWIDIYNPDIIHLHNLHGHYINIRLLFNYINAKHIPVIWTLHDCWAFTGKCVYFDIIKCMKWKKECSKCPQLKAYPSSFFDMSKTDYINKRKLFSSMPNIRFITPSLWLKGLVKNSFLNKYPTDIINNGIDIDVFTPMKMSNIELKNKLKNKFIVLAVASTWDKRKGYSDYIELAKRFNENYDVIFLIIGLNDKQLKCLPRNIIGLKRTENQTKLAELYSRADVVVNPTYEDNYPTVNLEAIACGTPVITYNTGGSGEIIDKTKIGFSVKKGDITTTMKKIIKMIIQKDIKTNNIELDLLSESKMFELYKNEYISLSRKKGMTTKMNYKVKTAILIIAFNRPDTLEEVLKSVRAVNPKKLYLAMDAPRENNSEDDKKCNNVRRLLSNINWCSNISKKYRDNNVGCKTNVSKAINWAFENEEQLIILEDDLVPSISFFRFCDEMLKYYKDNHQVYQVCGFNVLQENKSINNSYYFVNYPIISGWATWKNAWEKYDLSLSNVSNKDSKNKMLSRYKNKLHGLYRYNKIKNSYRLTKKNLSHSWASPWAFTVEYNDGICVMPTKNLIRNIGFGEDAHNGGRPASPFAKPYAEEIEFPLKHPDIIKADYNADTKTLEMHFKNGYPYWYVYGSIVYRKIFNKNKDNELIGFIRRKLKKIATRKERHGQ